MGLTSALTTALTGLNAAETTIDVVGNNIANSQTVGFKASEAMFATQFLQTRSLGSAPTPTDGGTNPRQIGLGVQVAEITPDFTQGTIEISSSPSDLAIQGEGFFIVEGSQGERFFTRNGVFKTNAENELVTSSGNRLLGHGVDDSFVIQATSLVPLAIPLGAAAVAQATENVFFEGTLTPTGDIANTAAIIQSDVLGDATFTAPAGGSNAALANVPNTTGAGTTLTGQAGGSLAPLGSYQYRVVFVDNTGTESVGSTSLGPIALAAGQNQVQLNNLPTDPGGNYVNKRIYRTTNGGATFQLAGQVPIGTATFTDTVADGALGAALNTTALSGNYSYYVTFANSSGGPGTGVESRPSPIIGPLNVVNGRIQLTNIPTDSSGQWSVRRIYRNLSTNDGEFHFVAEIPNNTAGQTFTDNSSDATILANALLNLNGPGVSTNTPLVNLLRLEGSTYESIFEPGTLEFSGKKGGRTLATKSLEVTPATTVLDLLNFMEDSLGIQEVPGPDSTNPIPGDASGASPGGQLTSDGRLRLVGNNGVDNAIDLGLSGLQLRVGNNLQQIDLPFGTVQEAVGQSAVSDFVVYDSLGIPLNVRVTAVLENRDGNSTTYRWFADSGDNDPLSGTEIAVGTGLIQFDGEGRVTNVTENTVAIDRQNISSVSPLAFDLDFNQLSGLAVENSTLAASRQDGSAPGTLASFIIGEDGRIRGVFSNGVTRDLGQIRLARFANAAGLEQKGENLFASGINSGLPVEGNPNEQGIGTIIAGAVELSNTDIGANLIDLILASTQYRGNTRVITAAQQLLDELLNLRR